MNNSKFNLFGMGSSPGFLYYNVNTPESPQDKTPNNSKSDFIEFNNTESPQEQFQPKFNSSPQKNFRQRFSNNFKKRNRSYNSNNDSGNSGNRNASYGKNRKSNNFYNNKSYNQKKFDPDDISLYVCKSMTENPWKELEELLKNKSHSESDKELSDHNSNESGEIIDD